MLSPIDSHLDSPKMGAHYASACSETSPGPPSPPTRERYHALAWLTAASFMAYLCRHAIGPAESTIRRDLGLSLEQSGWFMGAFFWTYAVLQVPSGWFAERSGTRICLSLCAIGWSLATLGIGLAPALWILIVAQLVMGAAQAGILPASCNSIGHWMPMSQRTFSCGILASGMQAGAIAASGLTAVLIAQLGWRWAFAAFSLPGILWAIGFFVRFRDHPHQSSAVNSSELALIRSSNAAPPARSLKESSEYEELAAIISSPAMWWLCGQQICRAAGYMFFVSWLPTFFQETSAISVESSGYLQGIILLTMLAGNVLSGVLTDWIWRRTGNLRTSRGGVAAASLATCSLCVLGAWLVTSTAVMVTLLALGGFFLALAGPCAFAAAIDIGGERTPQVVAVMNMSGNFAAAICPVMVAVIHGYANDWSVMLLLFALLFLTGAFFWLLVDPRACYSLEK